MVDRSFARAATVAAGLVLLAFIVPASPSSAVTDIASGSWWSGQNEGGNVPPPPSLPAAGLWVQSSPNGATAVSALRFHLAEEESSPVVTLKVHLAAPPGNTPVVACSTSTEWNPMDAGPRSAEPEADCSSGSVAGVFSADNTLVTFDLSGFARGRDVNVVLRPGSSLSAPATPVAPPTVPALPGAPVTVQPDTSTGAGFDITFEKPDTAAIAAFVSAPEPTAEDEELFDFEPATQPESFETFAPIAEVPSFTLDPIAVSPIPVATSTPRHVIRSVPATLAAPLPKDARDASRILAGVVFLALLAYAARDSLGPALGVGGQRRRLTIYDVPTSPRPAITTPSSRPPALR